MKIDRRRVVSGLMAVPGAFAVSHNAFAQTAALKISHQFPGGTADQGDFRDRLCRRFGAEVEKRTNGALKFEIYPNASLMRVVAQFGAVRRGALDLSLYPLSYAGGEVQELNVTALPALVTSYDQAFRWKNSDLGRELVSGSIKTPVVSKTKSTTGIRLAFEPLLSFAMLCTHYRNSKNHSICSYCAIAPQIMDTKIFDTM